jgi:Cu/Ag efflux pump CusA
LLQAAIGSWRLGAVAFLALPMALSGGILMIRIIGGDLTMGALIGLLTVLGLAVRHLLQTVHHYQEARSRGEEFGPELVREGSRECFGSVLTSTVVTALAVAPLAIFGRIAGLEVLAPMAMVILGGLVTTALMSIYVIPGLYMQFGRNAAPEWSADSEEEADRGEAVLYAKG